MAREQYLHKKTMRLRRDPLSLNRTALEATSEKALVHVLPDLPKDVVKALLTQTPFKSVMGQPWAAGAFPGWAATADSDFHIVPKKYFGAFIPTSTRGCMHCHDSAGRHVDNFEPARSQMFAPEPSDLRRPRTWYDMIPGDDGILSFHPFSVKAVKEGEKANLDAVNPCLKNAHLLYWD